GAEFFGVGSLDEGIELGMDGIDGKILVLGVIGREDINKAIEDCVGMKDVKDE
ncbi:alanine racemase, partial [Staphylococcus saprophyticus]|uniref:alanine racemase n=1 Tax=Staphylococcus saprophyticus TaxID=29385 RepID=UPI003703DFC9